MAILLDAEEGSQVLAGDAHALVQIVVLHQTDGGLAAQGGDLALQIAHARFTGVGTDDLQDGAVGQRDVLRLQAVFLHLARQQEVAGDLALFRLQIAVELDDLHAVQQRCRDGIQRVGRGDEEHLGEVVLQIQIVVHEGVVLFRVQHFQQGRGRVAPEVRGHLVDLVQAEQGVAALYPFQGLDDLAGQGAHIGTAVTADLGLVTHAAQGKAHVFASRGPGHTLGQRGLAHAWRAHEAEDGTAQAVGELLHGQIFQDAVLGLFQTEVVAFKDGTGLFDVDIDLFEVVPGQIQQPVHIIAHHGVFRGRGRHAAQLAQFGLAAFTGFLRHVAAFELLFQLVHFRLGIVLAAHLLVDGLELLAKVVLALVALHLYLDAVLDALFHRGQGHFALQKLVHALQALGDVGDLQHFLLLAVIHLEVGHHGVGQRPRIAQGHDGHERFLGQLLVVLGVLFQRFLHGTHQGLALFGAALAFRHGAEHGHQAVVLFAQLRPAGTVQAFEQHLDGAVGQAQHLQDLADDPHGAQIIGAGLLHIGLALGHQEHLLVVAGLGQFDGLDGGFAPHEKRHDGTRQHDHFAQGHDRQLGKKARFALEFGHSVPRKRAARAARSAVGTAGPDGPVYR